MEFGVHIPQIGWQDQEPADLDGLIAVATAAERLGFGTITANDHLVMMSFSRRKRANSQSAATWPR